MDRHFVYKTLYHEAGYLADWPTTTTTQFLPLERLLAPAESKPTLLSRLFLRLTRLGVRLALLNARLR